MLNNSARQEQELLAPAFAQPLRAAKDVRSALSLPLAETKTAAEQGRIIAAAYSALVRGGRGFNSGIWQLLILSGAIEGHAGSSRGKTEGYSSDFMRGVRSILTDTEISNAVDHATQDKLLMEALSGKPDEFTAMVLSDGRESLAPFTQAPLMRLFAGDVTPLLPTLKRWVIFNSSGFQIANRLANFYQARRDDDRAAFYIVMDQRTQLRGLDIHSLEQIERLATQLATRLGALSNRDDAVKGVDRFDAWGVGQPMP